MDITKEISGEETIIILKGWLDTQASPMLHEEIEKLDEGTKNLVLDFSHLEYISSSGVREVVAAYKKMNGALLVKNASDGIMSIFKATGIDKKIRLE